MEKTSVKEQYSSSTHFVDDSLELEGLKEQLVRVVSSSTLMDARVWLDGVYTSLQDLELKSRNGHELYYKIEGKLDGRRSNR